MVFMVGLIRITNLVYIADSKPHLCIGLQYSVGSNIAEGFSRGTIKDKVQFYCVSHGSLTELQNQLVIARDIQYITKEEFSALAEQTILVHKLITGLKRIKNT
jgi:four helix bundle protein